ncbi:MAG: response regulator [Chloroflexota bacterium]
MSTILIVDDAQSARETLVALLENENYQLHLAEDGFQALQMLGNLQPDLILLDVMMPGLDGFEVCRRIRSMPRLAEVPIIILTALDDRASLLQGIESGADDFLHKPIDRQELLARVRTITRLNRYRTLLEQRENLREMAERLITAQEEERLRISRELHDDLGQALTTHMLALRNFQSDLSLPVTELFEGLQALYDQSYEIAIKIRRLAQDLRPPILDTLGLKQAIETYCSKFSERTQLPIILEVEPDLPTLPDVYNVTLYRVLQEALTNVAKHAEANRIWVELGLDDNSIHLIIQDNGHGLEQSGDHTNGIGLTGMNERLSLVGGKLLLRSALEGGTILTASVPVKAETPQGRKIL